MSAAHVSRTRMTMRTKVERYGGASTNSHGHVSKASGTWSTHIESLPCYVWSTARREVRDGNKNDVIEDLRAIVPLATDVLEKDRLVDVKDRIGGSLRSGRMNVLAVVRRASHLELRLEAVV